MDESVKDLQELYSKGLVPKASNELRNSLDELMYFIKQFSQQLENLGDDLKRVSSYDLVRLLYNLSDELKDIIPLANQLDLENPYEFDSLEHFNRVLKSKLDDIGQTLIRNEWFGLDSVRNNFIRLDDDVMPEFEKNVLREKEQNEEKFSKLKQAEQHDVLINPMANKEKPKTDEEDKLSGFNLGVRPQEHEMHATDVVKSAGDDKRQIETDVQQQDRAADKQSLKKPEPQVLQKPKTPQKPEENNLEKLDSLVKKYGDLYARVGSILDPEYGDELLQIKNEIAATIDEITRKKEVSDFTAKGLRESLDYMVANSLHAERHTDGIQRMGRYIDGEKDEQHFMSLDPKKREQVISSLGQIAEMVDRQHADESLKNMMTNLKRLADQKVIPQDMVDDYRSILDKGKNGWNRESLVLDLGSTVYNHISDLQKLDRTAKEKAAAREREIHVADARGQKKQEPLVQSQYKGQEKPMQSQHRDGDYLGFGRRVGRDMDAGLKKHNELSGAEKTNKFKDAIVNVLNKREAEQHAAQMKEKEPKDNAREAQEKALIKKLFMKTNND